MAAAVRPVEEDHLAGRGAVAAARANALLVEGETADGSVEGSWEGPKTVAGSPYASAYEEEAAGEHTEIREAC